MASSQLASLSRRRRVLQTFNKSDLQREIQCPRCGEIGGHLRIEAYDASEASFGYLCHHRRDFQTVTGKRMPRPCYLGRHLDSPRCPLCLFPIGTKQLNYLLSDLRPPDDSDPYCRCCNVNLSILLCLVQLRTQSTQSEPHVLAFRLPNKTRIFCQRCKHPLDLDDEIRRKDLAGFCGERVPTLIGRFSSMTREFVVECSICTKPNRVYWVMPSRW
jgi:hypothetical protein